MVNEIFDLEVEILNQTDIITCKKYLEKNSISFYEDFLLDHVVFIKTNLDFKNSLFNNPKLKIHTKNYAYQM